MERTKKFLPVKQMSLVFIESKYNSAFMVLNIQGSSHLGLQLKAKRRLQTFRTNYMPITSEFLSIHRIARSVPLKWK